MKKFSVLIFLIVIVLVANVSVSFSTSSVDNSIMYDATLAKALKIKDWMSSGNNRALLAFCLAANAADDKVLHDTDLLFAIMQNNPTFVGIQKGNENLMVATITEKNMYLMYYSPTLQKAYVGSIPHNKGIDLGSIALESAISSSCTKYYRVTADEMSTAIRYLQSITNN